MQDKISLEREQIEHERLRLLKGGLGASSVDGVAALINKIEALKVLTRAFLAELESLTDTLPLESGRDVELSDEVHRFEADMIRCALIRTGGRQRRAACLLHMKVATLNAKIKRYRLDNDELIKAAASLRQHHKAKS